MNRLGLRLGTALLFAAAMSLAAAASPAQMQNNQNSNGKTFSGVIMDSACAQMGSHEQMENKHGMKGNDRLTGKEARECTEACVKSGSTYVLYDPANKTVYQLSDQSKARQYAGDRVRVRGTYDESSKTINVESISPSRMKHSSSPGR